MTEAAQTDYARRAGNASRPDGWVDDWTDAHLTLEAADEVFATTQRIFWADISRFQPVVNSTYPYRQLAIRLDSGFSIDENAAENRARVAKIDHIEVLLGYCVFRPGQSKSILGRLKNAFGSDPEFAVMTDMESGSEFAGPGNHSAEANDFVNELADWTSRARQVGYANGYDWASNWPNRPDWLKRATAAYGTNDPGTWSWQYYGGLNYPSPAGFPRSCPPFGGWVDMNTAKLTPDGFKDDLGLDWLSMATKQDVADLIDARIEHALAEVHQDAVNTVAQGLRATLLGGDHGPFKHSEYPKLVRDEGNGVLDRVYALENPSA